jgi:sphinganine-1-phosphate aldolase
MRCIASRIEHATATVLERIAMRMPEQGTPWADLRMEIQHAQSQDIAKWRTGRAFGVAYGVSDELLEVIEQTYSMYVLENARHHHAYPSLKRFEDDVVGMTADLFHGERAVGNFVSGGTEGIFLAVKTARDKARHEKNVTSPQIVVPATAYPIWWQVGHYLNVKVVTIPITAEFRADIGAMRSAIGKDTILIMGSAPGYVYGVMDPISEMSDLAEEFGIHLHIDACVGGYQLPFLRELGRHVPDFDFLLPGVTSIGADLHKYGYTSVGSSVLLYRNADVHKYQAFQFDGWRSGAWLNPAMLGSRPGGSVAAAWAVMKFLGRSGYLELTRRVTATADRLRQGIEAIPGLTILGKPEMSVFTYISPNCEIEPIVESMREKGWFVRPSSRPPSIHVVVTPMHERVVDQYLADLKLATCGAAAMQGAQLA